MDESDPQPAPWRVIVVETAIPGVLIGQLPVLLAVPADPEVGLTTTDPGESW